MVIFHSYVSLPEGKPSVCAHLATAMWQAVGTRGSQSFVDLAGLDGVVIAARSSVR